jgi:hypothetical protein
MCTVQDISPAPRQQAFAAFSSIQARGGRSFAWRTHLVWSDRRGVTGQRGARQMIEGRIVVTVVPITHSLPFDEGGAVEIPPALKAHLGLDDLRSWIAGNVHLHKLFLGTVIFSAPNVK